ncbi:MAG: T9SS type A sorting domain-containing protein [Bacteroidetes bacterium]|nr:T9SS type A sorting domain-containing protein [Bacteroidota bacterium]
MKARNQPFSAQIGRYKHLAKKVNQLVKSGDFQLLTQKERRSLLNRLKNRLNRIRHLIPQANLKTALSGISFLLGIGFSNPIAAQQFAPAIASPFGIEPGTTSGYQSFADLDGDGDLDLVINNYDYVTEEYKFLMFENIGTAQTPAFTADNYVVNPFGIVAAYLSQPSFVDIDNDGDLDLFSGVLYGGGFQFQENTGTATAPQFQPPIHNPFGLQLTSPYECVTFADLDNDGDLDILSGGGSGSFSFFENIGTIDSPSFAAPIASPFGLSQPGEISIPQLADLDGDGDYDLISLTGSYYGLSMTFWENTGTVTVPSFGPSIDNPFGIGLNGLYIAFPSPADIDGDGDMDVFVNDYFGSDIYFYQNLHINVEYPPTSADNSINMPEDGNYIFDATDFSFFDDNLGQQLQAVQITALPDNGILKFGSNSATIDQIIQVTELASLTFNPALNEFGTNYTNFKFKVFDGVLWSLDEYTSSFNVTPVNDPPTTQDAEVTGSKEFQLIFKASDFPYSDIENDPENAIRIISLPNKGALKLNGNAVTAGQSIQIVDIENLTFKGEPDESGTPYTSFVFKVADGSSLSNTATMTINILESSSVVYPTLDANVTLFPNPASETLNIHLEASQLLTKPVLQIFDTFGRIVTFEQLNDSQLSFNHQINVHELDSGYYFLKIESTGKARMVKFIKK